MMTLRETVARALWEAQIPTDPDWKELRWQEWLVEADVAIAAVRAFDDAQITRFHAAVAASGGPDQSQ
jgi:hypothetical protein